MRKCKGATIINEDGRYKKVNFDLGYFHQWGLDYVDYSENYECIVNYTVAIVELPDGQVAMCHPDDIQFLEPIDEVTNDF